MKTLKQYYREIRKEYPYPQTNAANALYHARTCVTADKLQARDDISIELIATQEVHDYDFEDEDGSIAKELNERLNSGDVWAWCSVEVKVSILCECCKNPTKTDSEYLGGCSYNNEADFIHGGYFSDLVNECLDRLEQ